MVNPKWHEICGGAPLRVKGEIAMNFVRSCFAGLLMLMSIDAMWSPASATWLGLADGTYDVTLSCVTSSVIACPSTIGGTMAIAAAAPTAFNFFVNGPPLVGAPSNPPVT